MKTLLKFAFKRRFMNKMTVILQVIFILLVCLIFYFDKISDVLNLEFNQAIPINIESSLRKFIVNEDEWTRKFLQDSKREALRSENERRRRHGDLKPLTPPNDDGKPKEVIATIEDGKATDWGRWSKIFGFKI